jgi:hypothetical protein
VAGANTQQQVPGNTLWTVNGFEDGKEFGNVLFQLHDGNTRANMVFVEIYEPWRNKSLCGMLVGFALKSLVENFPSVLSVALHIQSTSPLTANACYQRAAFETGFTVFGHGMRLTKVLAPVKQLAMYPIYQENGQNFTWQPIPYGNPTEPEQLPILLLVRKKTT